MKKIILLVLLAGCSPNVLSGTQDAGLITENDVYISDKAKKVVAKYYTLCMKSCYFHTGSSECRDKCDKDFKQILKLMVRCVKENKEDDFDSMMDGWYGHMGY